LFQETPELEPGKVQAIVLMVTGRVQGVGFRFFTEREALRRGVNGYVRNLENGGVEIRAQADEDTLAKFRAVVERGPSGSRVDAIEATPAEIDETLTSFQVRF
jgi:acylphosphatase